MMGPMTEHTDTEHTDQAAMHDGESEATAVRDFRAHVVAIGAFGGDGVIRDHRFAPIDQELCANPSALLKLRLGD
jgi:hypothetical protein